MSMLYISLSFWAGVFVGGGLVAYIATSAIKRARLQLEEAVNRVYGEKS